MAALFSRVLNMSMTGSVVILLVMLVRLFLKRSPKIFSYALWSVVLFRLLCPVAFTASISILDAVDPEIKQTPGNTSMVTYIPANADTRTDFIAVQPQSQTVYPAQVSEPEEQLQMTPMHAVSLGWAAGAAGMLLYSAVQYLLLRRKLIGAMGLSRNIYLADSIDTAFVVGLVKPKIYLPSSVPVKERFYILSHEQHHIRRFDHVIKLLAYLALCIHWFNPLVWLAFVLAGRDMEMSCDEAVIKKLGAEIRADYSASLLRLATHKKNLSGMPLAFGEGDTKGRVLNMAKWKKPTKWLAAICLALCICVVAVCAFNPEEETSIEELTRQTSEGPVDTAIGDLCFIYPGGLTSEQRDVDNWNEEDRTRSRLDLPTRRPYNHFFIDNGVDFGGVVDFVVPEDREIRLEEMNLPTAWVGLDYISGSSSYPYAEMEYTLIKDGKDYIQLYLYTYSGRGYFLWFYTEQGNAAHKEAILNSVKLGSFTTIATKLKEDKIVSLGQFNVTVPRGYGYYRNEAKILEITKKDLFNHQKLLGCVTAIPNPNLPMDTDEERRKWVEAIGIDLSYEGKSYGYSITDETEYGDIYVNREELLHGNTVLAENHYIYIAGDIVYDFCLDVLEIDSAKEKVLLESIWIKTAAGVPGNEPVVAAVPQPPPTIPASDIATGPDMVQYGTLKMRLPSNLSAREQDGDVVLTRDSVDVGGITCWTHPGFQPDHMVEWIRALGIPELQEGYPNPIAYMAGGSLYGSMEIEISWDGNPLGLNEEHQFFIDGNIVYDVWYDQNLISDGIAERFLKTVAINEEPASLFTPEELAALEKCKAVLDTVQSGSHHIAWEKTRTSATGSSGYRVEYLSHGEDWLHITGLQTEKGVENQYRMKVGGEPCFGVVGVDRRTDGNPAEESQLPLSSFLGEPERPWLSSYQWDEATVAYVDTLQEDGMDIIMLRLDEPFYGYPEETESYNVDFFFDGSGSFLRVKLTAFVFRNNDLWTAEETETIYSLDPEKINRRIQSEYDSFSH